MMMVAAKSIRFSGSFSGERASFCCHSSSSSTSRSDVSVDPLVRQRPWLRPCAIRGFVRRTVEDSTESGSARVSKSAVLVPGRGADEEVGHSWSFLTARSGEELLSCIWKKVEFGHISSDVASRLEELYYNYHNAVMQSGDLNASELILSNMAVTFDRIILDMKDPFKFAPFHRAIRRPFDYYMFGQNYFRPLIDFRRSYIGNISLFFDMELKLQQGHNVILISNHQTEADPYLIALLLERTNPFIAEKMVFVAGDRVIMDQLCKPFSMGRNLLCVYSKKHIDDVPELVDMKRASNTKCLCKMASLLRIGSQIIWVAPSGGRDRPDPLTGELYPAPFDIYAMDNMRRILDHSGVPGHIYPLALLCNDVMPPPPEVEKQIGERRKISFHGIGLSVAPQMNFGEITAGYGSLEEAKQAFASAFYDSVVEQHNVLKCAIYGHQGLSASSNSAISLSQPWL